MCPDALPSTTPKKRRGVASKDALSAHFEVMREIGEPIPEHNASVDYVEVAAWPHFHLGADPGLKLAEGRPRLQIGGLPTFHSSVSMDGVYRSRFGASAISGRETTRSFCRGLRFSENAQRTLALKALNGSPPGGVRLHF
jgi:hypothetical protein